jgi:DNA invertase Pin-like site-specific DNA recombinase
MGACAYIRVSHRGQDLGLQRTAIEKTAALNGETITAWYAEKKSAKTVDRPELQRLLADARAGRLAGMRCYVFRYDRIARSGIRDMLTVVDVLRTSGCTPVSCTDGFALDGPAGDVVLAVLAFAAQVELLAKNERVAAARDRLAKAGRPWGRPSRLTEEQRDKILSLRDAGRSLRKIAIAVKVPLATVARACRKGGAKTATVAPSTAGRQRGAFLK